MKTKTTIVGLGILAGSVLSLSAGPAPFISTPEPAGSQGLRGSLGVTLGQSWMNDSGGALTNDEDDEYGSALVELKLGYDFNSNWYGQLDIIGELTDVSSNTNDSYQHGYGAAIHLLNSNNIGFFGGWFTTTQDNDNTDTTERFIVGVEGLTEVYGYDLLWQVGGVLGNGGSDSNGKDSLRDVYFARLAASKSLGNGWSYGAEIMGGKGDMDLTRNALTLYGWGAHVKKEMGPDWTVALVYNGAFYDQGTERDIIREHFVGLNATYYFGAGSSDGSGPKLSLPPILRWMGITGGQLE